mmetsp:Transcript_94021/g.298526  ORF Transcript_94021/g.298526 Transcript_94021/m.298526 type:complete len:274 (+) Transcript_94021:94-915(+)
MPQTRNRRPRRRWRCPSRRCSGGTPRPRPRSAMRPQTHSEPPHQLHSAGPPTGPSRSASAGSTCANSGGRQRTAASAGLASRSPCPGTPAPPSPGGPRAGARAPAARPRRPARPRCRTGPRRWPAPRTSRHRPPPSQWPTTRPRTTAVTRAPPQPVACRQVGQRPPQRRPRRVQRRPPRQRRRARTATPRRGSPHLGRRPGPRLPLPVWHSSCGRRPPPTLAGTARGPRRPPRRDGAPRQQRTGAPPGALRALRRPAGATRPPRAMSPAQTAA